MAENKLLRCPSCDSPRIVLGLDYPFLNPNEFVCHACGVQNDIPPADDILKQEEPECPHCGKIGAFETYADEEWCVWCGLDPDREHSSQEIAHMWAKGSALNVLLSSDDSRFHLSTDRGIFIREGCGPFCPEAENCKQDFFTFEICFKQSQEGSGEDAVGRKSRNKKKQRQAQMYVAKPTRVAHLVCAGKGWLAGRLYGTDYKEPHRDSEPGSGAKAVS